MRAAWRAAIVLLLAGTEVRAAIGSEPTGNGATKASACRATLALSHEPGVLDADQVDTIKAEVTRLWERYGIEIAWAPVNARVVRPRPTVWITVVAAFELADRSAARSVPDDEHRHWRIAWVHFNKGKPLPLIRASVAAAHRVLMPTHRFGFRFSNLPPSAQAQGAAQALGRSIAHELGHYFLASGKHASRGLMRALIPATDLLDPSHVEFALTASDIEALDSSPIWRSCGCGAALTATPEGPP